MSQSHEATLRAADLARARLRSSSSPRRLVERVRSHKWQVLVVLFLYTRRLEAARREVGRGFFAVAVKTHLKHHSALAIQRMWQSHKRRLACWEASKLVLNRYVLPLLPEYVQCY